MKKIICNFLFIIFSQFASGQSFVKIIPNGPPFDFTYAGVYTLQTPSGDYIVACTVNDSAGSNIMIIKLDSHGNTILHNELLQPFYIESASSIKISQAGEFVISGVYDVPNTNWDDELLLAKTDLNGNPIFMKNLTSSGICCWDFATGNIFETAAHNYLIGGEGFGISSIIGYARLTDSAGNNMQTFSMGNYTRAEAIAENSAGEIIMGGKDFQLNQAVLTKRDANANFKWAKTYNKGLGGTVKNTSIMEMIQLPAGFLLAAKYPNPGTGHVDLWMIETDLNGDTVQTKSYADAGNIIGMQTTNNGYALAIIDSNTTGGYDFKIIRLDNNYNKISERTYGTANTDVLFSFEKCSDKGFVMSGLTYDSTFVYNALIIKTDSVGCVLPAPDFSWKQASLANNQAGIDFTDLSQIGIIDTTATYFWNFGDNNYSTLQNPQHIYAAQGTYVVGLTVTTLCGTDSIKKLVTATCTGTYNYFTHSSNLFTATFNDPDPGALAWNWSFGDSNSSTLKNPTHTYSAAGTYYVCLTKTNICGTFTMCDSVKIECPAPIVNTGPDKTLCAGQSVLIDAGNAGMNFLWNSGATTQSIVVSTAGTYIVTVANSCGASHTDTIIIGYTPPPLFTFGGDTSICAGDTLSFYNQPQPGFSYQWFLNNVLISSLDSIEYVFDQIGTYQVKCIATNKDCMDSIQIKIDANPIAVCTGSPPNYCIPTYTIGTTGGDYIKRFGVNTIMNVTGSTGGPAYNDYTNLQTDLTGNTVYTWTFEFNATNSMLAKMWIDFNMDGTFDEPAERVYLLAANSGTTTANFAVASSKFYGGLTRLRLTCADVSSYALVQPCATYTHGETEDYAINLINTGNPPISNFLASDSTIKINDAVNFTSMASNNAINFNWTFTGATPASSSLKNPTNITYSTPGCYDVLLSAANANGSDVETKKCFIDVANNVGLIDENTNNETAVSYIEGQLNFYNKTGVNLSITVYDAMGKVFRSIHSSQKQITVNMDDARPGYYIAKCKSKWGVLYSKLFVLH